MIVINRAKGFVEFFDVDQVSVREISEEFEVEFTVDFGQVAKWVPDSGEAVDIRGSDGKKLMTVTKDKVHWSTR